jgi:hypothetical protein
MAGVLEKFLSPSGPVLSALTELTSKVDAIQGKQNSLDVIKDQTQKLYLAYCRPAPSTAADAEDGSTATVGGFSLPLKSIEDVVKLERELAKPGNDALFDTLVRAYILFLHS